MQKSNDSFLSNFEKSEIENLTEAIVINDYKKGTVNVEAIAETQGICYSYGNYEDSFDGLLEYDSGDFHIYINNDRLINPYSERARFTFAHELGHYFIDEHRVALSRGLINSHPSFTGFSSDLKMERQADYFASCLLLPQKWIKEDCAKRRFNFALIQELSKKYQASITATALRIANIGVYPIMIIYSKNSKIKWYWCTENFSFWSLLHGKDKVPENTSAGEFFYENRKNPSTETVYAGDWFNIRFSSDKDRPFYEHCIYGVDGSVLSIIWED